MPGTVRAAIEIAALGTAVAALAPRRARQAVVAGRERRKDRIEPLGLFARAADHQAVAALEPPHPAAGADVEKVDTALRQRGGPPHVVLIEGVAAVDHRVARRQQRAERLDGLLGHGARGQHDPHGARRVELLDEIGEAVGGGRAFAGELPHHGGVGIVGDAAVLPALKPAHDIGTHAAESHHAKLHSRISLRGSTARLLAAQFSGVIPGRVKPQGPGCTCRSVS